MGVGLMDADLIHMHASQLASTLVSAHGGRWRFHKTGELIGRALAMLTEEAAKQAYEGGKADGLTRATLAELRAEIERRQDAD